MDCSAKLSEIDKLELDTLIEKTIDNVNASKHVAQSKAFNKLTSRLFLHEESVPSSSSESSSMFISKVQGSSHLYDSSAEAAPLHKKKANSDEGLKGWFGMKVTTLKFSLTIFKY